MFEQGLWTSHTSTPAGDAPGDFEQWHAITTDSQWFAALGPPDEGASCHVTGVFAGTVVEEAGNWWVYFHGVEDADPATPACSGDATGNQAHLMRARLTEVLW